MDSAEQPFAKSQCCERRRENGLILPVSKWTVFVSSVGHHGIRSTPAKIRGQSLKAMLVVMMMDLEQQLSTSLVRGKV